MLAIGILMIRNLFQKKIKAVFYLTIIFRASIIFFGMQLAKTITVNSQYKSLAELNDWQAESKLPVYEFEYFTPELIWAYGKPIKVLSKAGKVKFPLENKFSILVDEDHTEKFTSTFVDYNIEKITFYDMNAKGPINKDGEKEKSHKPRLYRDLYVLTKH